MLREGGDSGQLHQGIYTLALENLLHFNEKELNVKPSENSEMLWHLFDKDAVIFHSK